MYYFMSVPLYKSLPQTMQAPWLAGALKDFEGTHCVNHKTQNVAKHVSKSNFISGVEKSCRGIIAHFLRSGKIMKNVFFLLPTDLLIHFVFLSQATSKLQELSPTITRPNQGLVTWWGGIVDIYIWIGKHWETLDKRYVEPEYFVENDDGTTLT